MNQKTLLAQTLLLVADEILEVFPHARFAQLAIDCGPGKDAEVITVPLPLRGRVERVGWDRWVRPFSGY